MENKEGITSQVVEQGQIECNKQMKIIIGMMNKINKNKKEDNKAIKTIGNIEPRSGRCDLHWLCQSIWSP